MDCIHGDWCHLERHGSGGAGGLLLNAGVGYRSEAAKIVKGE